MTYIQIQRIPPAMFLVFEIHIQMNLLDLASTEQCVHSDSIFSWNVRQ